MRGVTEARKRRHKKRPQQDAFQMFVCKGGRWKGETLQLQVFQNSIRAESLDNPLDIEAYPLTIQLVHVRKDADNTVISWYQPGKNGAKKSNGCSLQDRADRADVAEMDRLIEEALLEVEEEEEVAAERILATTVALEREKEAFLYQYMKDWDMVHWHNIKSQFAKTLTLAQELDDEYQPSQYKKQHAQWRRERASERIRYQTLLDGFKTLTAFLESQSVDYQEAELLDAKLEVLERKEGGERQLSVSQVLEFARLSKAMRNKADLEFETAKQQEILDRKRKRLEANEQKIIRAEDRSNKHRTKEMIWSGEYSYF